jgi:hypothetical protein
MTDRPWHPLVGLMRRFCVDWLCRADPTVPGEIMASDYAILIGGHTLAGRDEQYVPGTLTQLRRFPGLLVSVHELFTTGDAVAMRFTEHGPSTADGGRPAAWTGIGLFWWDGERLTRNVTEEDYHSRRRQLAGRCSDPVDAPAPAPWSATPAAPDPGAEHVVRAWLAGGDLAAEGAVLLDDGWCGRPTPPLLDVDEVRVAELFSAGDRVAFQVVQTGRYVGGLPDTDGCAGRAAELSAVGMVRVADGTIVGHVVRDRVGLRRRVRSR